VVVLLSNRKLTHYRNLQLVDADFHRVLDSRRSPMNS
jgi:hypothetical protein